ncbi:MAG: hypothetical protein ACRDPH_10860 [Marmoricola sp.]
MTPWVGGWQLAGLVVAGLVVLAVLSAVAGAVLVRLGMRTPFAVRRINRATDKVVDVVKRPITIAVLDEVADVIQTGSYTRNISAALKENRGEIKALVAENLKHDPNVRLIGHVPGYDTVVDLVSETTLRVIIDSLGDPRMDELVSDLLRNNLEQIRQAVRQRQNEHVPTTEPPGPPVRAPRRRPGPG